MECFVFQNRNSVANENLPELGVLTIPLGEGTQNVDFQVAGEVTFTLSNGYFRDYGSGAVTGPSSITITSTTWKEMVIPAGGANLTISNKYLVKKFYFGLLQSITTEELKYMIKLEYLRVPANTITSGVITDLGKMTSLTYLEVTGNNNLHGTVEAFVAKQRKNGRTTGSLTGSGSIGACTILDAATGQRVLATGKAENNWNYTLSWTATTITLDDNTITA